MILLLVLALFIGAVAWLSGRTGRAPSYGWAGVGDVGLRFAVAALACALALGVAALLGVFGLLLDLH